MARGPGLNAINSLGLEDYVMGVVGNESPASWPLEALKAQAVAARTYALASNAGGRGFSQYADTRSQVYRGVLSETPSTTRATQATAGQVVTYGGNVATTFFFSTSGGQTENIENAFPGSTPKPWLKGVDDPYDNASPYHRWGPFSYSRRGLGARLGSWVKGSFRRIDILQRGVSPRVVQARVVGTRGRTPVTGPQLRTKLGLRDTWLYVRRVRTRTSSVGGFARAAARGRMPTTIAGSVTGRNGTVTLQRREGSRWVPFTDMPVHRTKDGLRYELDVVRPGAYRVMAGWAPARPSTCDSAHALGELDRQHLAVRDDVVAALGAQEPALARRGERAAFDELLPADHLRADEALPHVRMDPAGASSAVAPRGRLQARTSFSPTAVKNVIRPSRS